MGRRNLAVPVKLWALACTIIGISLTTDTLLTCVLTVAGFIYLGVQRNWRFLRSHGSFLRSAWDSVVPDPVPRFPSGGIFGILCADVLEPDAGVSGIMGSDYHAARRSWQPFYPVSTRRVLSFWAYWSCSVFFRL